jgi:hypothetical protein
MRRAKKARASVRIRSAPYHFKDDVGPTEWVHTDGRQNGAEKAEVEARLAEAPGDVPDVHPNTAELYRKRSCTLRKR